MRMTVLRTAPRGACRCLYGRRAVSAPVCAREHIPTAGKVDGPALITEATATTIVEPGWQAEMTEIGDLVLRRVAARDERVAIGTSRTGYAGSVQQSVLSIAEQMGYTFRTSSSVNVKELDFSRAIFDSTGSLIANAPHMPVHLGSMGESVRA